ncbi:amino acid ABC transporter substrate-binding protein [Alsobacter soli]|uniref:Amino acid ABC transporter substrate-binding protein n=1 Tax=Alsobacter soli TaxID=2109933 RepID=A0A2T1HTS5_9HYPH|nr:ABC transporter substrate-binding protein [Alsobacter soli]PSC05052.1 amino acid ABC transporter substrate-binding protein [Alsobacter soli]
MKSLAGALVISAALAVPAYAQTIKLIDVAELSGSGATVGTNFKNGADLAVAEINAKGGILGHKIEITHMDTQSNPGVARALVQKALDENPYALLGPGYSGSVKVTAPLVAQAGIAQVMGGEAAELTQMGIPTLFRTSFGQQSSMPKIAKYMAEDLKAKNVALLWVNNDFGKGGRDMVSKELQARGVKIVADLSTEAGQADFAADVVKVKNANPDAVFVYLNEEESARALKELRRQNVNVPLVGETTLLGQKVIELAGEAANGARGHVGLTVDAPIPALQEYGKKFQAKYNYIPDHNGIKGYLGVYMIKAATEKMGKLDPKGLPDALHGLTIKTSAEPGILLDLTIDKNGDLDRESFMGEVVNGKQVIKTVLPKLNP